MKQSEHPSINLSACLFLTAVGLLFWLLNFLTPVTLSDDILYRFQWQPDENAAKLWIEYALSPECVNLAAQNGSYQFLVIDNATQPEVAMQFGLDPDNVMDYDFEDAKNNIGTYIEEVMAALNAGGADTGADRFKTE